MAEGGQPPATSMSTASEECSDSIRTVPPGGGGQISGDSIYRTSQEDCEYCSLCLANATTRHNPAVKFCVDCSKYLCTTCLYYHGQFPTTSYHQVVDVDAHPATNQGAQVAFLPSEHCPEHRVQLIDTYCETHDIVCCGTCVALNHKTKCCKIKYIAEAAVGIKTSPEVSDIKQEIQSSCTELHLKKQAQDEAIADIDRERDNAKSEINKYRQQIKQHFDNLEKKALDEVNEKHKAAIDKLTTNSQLLNNSIAQIERNRDQIQNFSSNNEVQLFSYIKIAKQNVAIGRTALNTIEANKTNLSFNFKQKDNLTANATTLGVVDNIQGDEVTAVTIQSQSHYPIDKETDTNACQVLSSCTMSDGNTLMADRFNLKLKQFNEKFQFIEECDLPEFPWAVCETEAGQAAMTFPILRTVQFVSTCHSLTLTDSFLTEPPPGSSSSSPKFHTKGIAYHNRKLIVACIAIRRDANAEIRVYDMSGMFLKNLSDKTLSKYLSYPTNITISRDGERILIADLTRGLIMIDKDGNTIATIGSEHLHGGFGVCLGDNSQAFACGFGSNNVIQFNMDGGAVRQLLKYPSDSWKPTSLCYNTNTKKLAVTKSNCDIVDVYQLAVKKTVEG